MAHYLFFGWNREPSMVTTGRTFYATYQGGGEPRVHGGGAKNNDYFC